MTRSAQAWTDHPFADILPPGFGLSKSTARDGLAIVSIDHLLTDLHVDMVADGFDAARVKQGVDRLKRELMNPLREQWVASKGN